MIHTTIRIYPNGDKKINGVRSENLAMHISYNIKMRPGCAFMVDRFVIYNGIGCTDILNKNIGEYIEIKKIEDTSPYQ